MNLTVEHKDLLKELLNISMGRAASKLAIILEKHVTLTIPVVEIASPDKLMDLFGNTDEYYYTRQPFFGDISGEVITRLNRKGCDEIAKSLIGFLSSDKVIDEFTLDVSNILSGASLRGLCNQININSNTQPPVLYCPENQPLPNKKWKQCIVLHVSFFIEINSFETKTIICFSEDGVELILKRLQEILN